MFISYAADTKPLAEQLTGALESQGIEAWVDFKDLVPGQRWKDQLDRAVGAARCMLILVGPASRATVWQEAEWSAALARTWADANTRILPILFGQMDPPPFLRNWVHLRVDPDKEPSTWTRHVVDALRSDRYEVLHGAETANRLERQRRLDELSHAAEELRKDGPETPIVAEVRPE